LWKREGSEKKDLYVTGSMTIGKAKGDLAIHGDLKARFTHTYPEVVPLLPALTKCGPVCR